MYKIIEDSSDILVEVRNRILNTLNLEEDDSDWISSDIQYNNINTTIWISSIYEVSDNGLGINIKLVNDIRDPECLDLEIHYDKNKHMCIAYVAYVSSVDTNNCSVGKERVGTWLVEFSKYFIKDVVGLTYMYLKDEARVKCRDGITQYELSLYKLYQGEKTFYGKLGFIPTRMNDYLHYLDLFRRMSSNVLYDMLDDKSFSMKCRRDIQMILNNYKTDNMNLTDYMKFLYKQDCIEYARLNECIYSYILKSKKEWVNIYNGLKESYRVMEIYL